MRIPGSLVCIAICLLVSCEKITEDSPQIFVEAEYPEELSVGEAGELSFYITSSQTLDQINLQEIKSDTNIVLSEFPIRLYYSVDSFNINYRYRSADSGLKSFSLYVKAGVYETTYPFEITVNP